MRIINKEVCSIMRTNVTWKVYYFNLENADTREPPERRPSDMHAIEFVR